MLKDIQGVPGARLHKADKLESKEVNFCADQV